MITLVPAARPGWVATPVSITATSTPAPVAPAAQAERAPMIFVTCSGEPVSLLAS
jgi:hypothetical protein